VPWGEGAPLAEARVRVMRMVAMLAGNGWLHPRGSIAYTVKYRLEISRRLTGPLAGEVVGRGTVEAESYALADARRAGRATLTIANGDSFAVDVSGDASRSADITVVGRISGF